MPKCDACRADGASQRCTNCQGCWSCDRACAKRFWPTHKKFCTDDPALKPHVPIELAIERALAKAPKMTEPPPETATCYICLETEGPENGGKVTRDCACRGPSAGFAHVECLAEMASRNAWIEIGADRTCNRWACCAMCQSSYQGSLALELSLRRWCRTRNAPASRQSPGTYMKLAIELRKYDERDAADRLDQVAMRPPSRSTPETRLKRDFVRAQCCLGSGRPHEALELLTRIRPSVESLADRQARSAYSEMMTIVLAQLGRLRDALPFAVEAVERVTELEGPTSPRALAAMTSHSHLLTGIGRVGEAKAALVRLLATETRVLGANHEQTLRTKQVLEIATAQERRLRDCKRDGGQ